MDQVDVGIVEAAPQDLTESPTEGPARLLPLPNSDNSSNGIVLPAALHMLGKSPHYTLAEPSNPQQRALERNRSVLSHLWYVDKPDAWADPSNAVYNMALACLYE